MHHHRPCCGGTHTDWDEFMRIPGCSRGYHSDEKMERPQNKPVDAPSSSTTFIAAPIEPPPVASNATPVPSTPLITPSGKYKCAHAGCGVEYDPASDESCNYHPGTACFRDTKKFWTCCKASSYDWDEFMQIPTCSSGRHEPKLVNKVV